MDQHEFQEKVIDQLARIETKQDITNGRVNKLEGQVQSLELTRASHSGASRLADRAVNIGSGLLGAVVGGLVDHFSRR